MFKSNTEVREQVANHPSFNGGPDDVKHSDVCEFIVRERHLPDGAEIVDEELFEEGRFRETGPDAGGKRIGDGTTSVRTIHPAWHS